MQVKKLLPVTKLASRISNSSSLTPLYRSIELTPDQLNCCSEFGNLEIALTSPTGLKENCLLDASSLMAVVSSLPQDSEITFDKQPTKVQWKCGSAKGYWNLVASEYARPKITHQTYPWTPPPSLAIGLLLASCACQAAAVSIGLYGIAMEPNGDKLRMLSSNSISLASTSVDKGTYPTSKVTLRPPVPSIIATLLQVCPDAVMDVTDDGIFMLGESKTASIAVAAHLPLGINLEHDLVKLADQFTGTTQVAKINTSAVKKFITRARTLADRNLAFTVKLSVDEGKLVLEHSGMASATEEFFLAEGLDSKISYKSVELPADMLLLPIEKISTVVLDYLKDGKLVLRGEDPDFIYVVSGGE